MRPKKEKKDIFNRYTICDAKKEALCREKLCKFIIGLKHYADLCNDFIDTQKPKAHRFIELSVRYNILKSGCPDMYIYPKKITEEVICEILDEKTQLLKSFEKALCSIMYYYDLLNNCYKEFHAEAYKLDWDVNSPFILGSAVQKPIKFYLDTCYEILLYFYVLKQNLKFHINLIQLNDVLSVENFEKSLHLSPELTELINTVVSYSKCIDYFDEIICPEC